MRTTGRLSVYNGGVSNGRTRFWLHALIPAPVTGTVLIPLEIRRDSDGIYRWTGTLELPKIANGAGSVTYLGVAFRKGIFSASCPTGKLQTHVVSRFADGQALGAGLVWTCRDPAG